MTIRSLLTHDRSGVEITPITVCNLKSLLRGQNGPAMLRPATCPLRTRRHFDALLLGEYHRFMIVTVNSE